MNGVVYTAPIMVRTFECICHWCGDSLVRHKQAKSVVVTYHFCDRKCKGEFQRTAKPVSKEWLIEHYIDKRMDCVDIAKIVNRDPKSVWNWLKDFGIPTRPRGTGMSKEKLSKRPKRFENANDSGSAIQPKVKKGIRKAGWKHSAESIEKMRRIQKEIGKDVARKRKCSESQKKLWTPEKRKELSERCKKEGRIPFKRENGAPLKGKFGPLHPNWKGGHTPLRQSFYSSLEWIKVAKVVRKRDSYSCRRCGEKKNGSKKMSFDIHHIVGFACIELRADADNLVYLCERCHYWVHSKKNVDKEFIKDCPNDERKESSDD